MPTPLRQAILLILLAITCPPVAANAQSPAPTDAALTPSAVPVAQQPAGRLPLEGTPWRLTAYRQRATGALRQPGPEVAAWMTLRAGKLKGAGGCTRVAGRYARMGSAVDFDLKEAPAPACDGQIAVIDLAMRAALEGAASFEVLAADEPRADQLVIRDVGGNEDLRFRLDDLTPPEIGEWRLTAYTSGGSRMTADPTQPAVLAFRATESSAARSQSSGEAVGSTGCNGIVGTYIRSADVLRLADIERTDAPCSPALEAQETVMYAVLTSTSQALDLTGEQLIITSVESGDSLELRTSSPLLGTTWQLTRLPRAPSSDQPITLHLADGSISGEGPCGPYHGSYVHDEPFITLSSLESARDGTCQAARLEHAFLDALARTVLLERDGRGLRLLDARGRTVARFGLPG
ncbi:MAG TPA: META domain-containing protein, partial [Candidatus Limnocylindrales bacterium]|nr:META domain-containing protein [Candidatus Limnocylindrales bacterium]